MRYETAENFRAALEDRLRQQAASERSTWLSRRRKLMAMDRLMARLISVSSNRWILKGGVALQLRLSDQARATKDLDLAHKEDEEAAINDLIEAQAVDLGDYFQFSIERLQILQEEEDPLAVRYRVKVELAGRQFETFTLDVGVGDTIPTSVETLRGPAYFSFADIAPIEVPALPLEQHVAEKIHAYTRVYGADRTSSRVKDLVDLVLIRSTATFAAGRLLEVIDQVFHDRNTHEYPVELPLPPTDWQVRYRAQANELDLDPDISVGFRLASEFINPVLNHTIPGSRQWDPVLGTWLFPERS